MKKFLRFLFILIGIVLILVVAIAIFAEPFIKSKLEKELTYYSRDSVKIGSVNVHYFPLGLTLKDTHFDLYFPMDTILVRWQGDIRLIRAGGIDWMAAWKQNKWEVGQIEVGEGILKWDVDNMNTVDTSRFKSGGKGKKPDILLEDINIHNLDLELRRKDFVVGLQTSINLDSLSLMRSDSVQWGVKRVVFKSEDASLNNVVEDFDLHYQRLSYDSKDSLLLLTHFEMTPRLSHEEFRKKYKYRKVQTSLKVREVRLAGIDLNRANRGLFAHSLTLDSCLISVYQDVRKERENVRKPLPSEMVAKLPVPVKIDTLFLKNGFLDYHHKAKDDMKLAYLKADRMNAKIYPISNLGHKECADLKMRASMRFMDQADLKLKADFLPDKPSHNFILDVYLGPTTFARFNPILYPTIGLKVKSGECERAHAHITGDDYVCQGKLDIAYHDFKIAIPPDQKEEQNIFGKTGEWLGNAALVNNDNDFGENNGNIYYDRELKRPFINYWWKGIQTGLMDVFIHFYKNKDK